ncbi:MAG: 1-acyl-sn-glycerol-3-phosphate acyltransferase [Cellvibrionaceae bacterium]|jgi:1-acyl-sn-glycerol-3-phosphate acyltransferase
MMKKEAFIFSFKSLFVKPGGIPIDRNQTEGLVVGQVADAFKKKDKLWLAMTPDGTRGKVSGYKTGFLRIAQLADVPILVVGWKYPTKDIVLDHVWNTTGDQVQDAADIRAYINERYKGRHPENQ